MMTPAIDATNPALMTSVDAAHEREGQHGGTPITLWSKSVAQGQVQLVDNSATASCGTTPPTGAIIWTTIWCDEFNGATPAPPDLAKWNFDLGDGSGYDNENPRWGNMEQGIYCGPPGSKHSCDGEVKAALRVSATPPRRPHPPGPVRP